MSKTSYKIPNSLDKSILDNEVSLAPNTNMSSIAIKVLLFHMCGLLLLAWLISATPVKNASFGVIALFVVWWLAAMLYFGHYSKTKELRLQGLPALLRYLPKANRRVMTRSSSAATGMYAISGIKNVEPDGNIRFADGTFGRSYLVVGSASILVFEADMHAMLNRADQFYRKVETTCEYLWITTKAPQRVLRQLASLERRNLALTRRDPELFALLDEQAQLLTEYVGRQFSSIHQYLVIKADNPEALRRAHALLQAEASESSLMIKGCTPLNGAEFTEMARSIYAN